MIICASECYLEYNICYLVPFTILHIQNSNLNMSEDRPKRRLLSRFEVVLLLIGGVILLYFMLKGAGLDPVRQSEETEIIDPYQ